MAIRLPNRIICMYNIFTLSSLVHIHLRLRKRSVHVVFVDFKKAFDSVPHNKLWNELNTRCQFKNNNNSNKIV